MPKNKSSFTKKPTELIKIIKIELKIDKLMIDKI